MANDGVLEERIGEWRAHFRGRPAVDSVDVEELEDHLRSQVEALQRAGLDDDEAFLVAVKRLGDMDSVSREFAREYTERLWKHLVVSTSAAVPSSSRGDAVTAIGLAVAAAVALKVPALFGKQIVGFGASTSFYALNFSLFILPFLAVFFALKRNLDSAKWLALALPFVLGGLIVNLLPFTPSGFTENLTVIHLPIALWLAVGFAYAGGEWRRHEQRMNFVRFSGEWFIYYTLIALGGGALMGLTVFIFHAIGLNTSWFMEQWVMPGGMAGAVLIAAWLVEAKQSVIENMAPVLTMLFTPLFTVLLLLFVGTMIWTGNAIDVGRQVLIGFDLLLVVVLGLLLYSISARDSDAAPGRFDALQLVLVCSALVVDILALGAIAARISEFGFSPNKTAALGLNLILLVNLGWSAVCYARFLAKRASFSSIERWQTAYLPVYAVWAWVVVAVFPLIFHYR